MSDQFAFDVFLSHSSKDKDVVRPLAERLRKDGIRVWFDEWEIGPGDSKPTKIEDGLKRSRALVFCMSAQAFSSDWTALESQTFRFRDPLNKDRGFIPVRLDEAPIKNPLAQSAYIDWQPSAREKEYPKLLEACRPIAREHTAPIRSVALSADGRYALSGSDDMTIRVWDVTSGRALRVMGGHIGSVMSVALSADSRYALSGSADWTLRLWELESARELQVMEGHVFSFSVLSAALSVDAKYALSGSKDETVRLWDLDSGRELLVMKGHSGSVWCVALSADGRYALSGSADRTLRLWDLDTGRTLRELEGHSLAVLSVALSGDGRHALSGSDDKTLRLWELDSGHTLRVLEGHSLAVLSVALCGDGKHAVSGSDDNTVRLWELVSGRTLRVMEGHSGPVSSVAVSADGQTVLSGSFDGTLRLWDLASGRTLRVFGEQTDGIAPSKEQVQYTNAKVLLVGDSSAGKTGLSMRLALDKWEPSDSTVGAWATQWKLPAPSDHGVEREIWLWDFGGQADQRLIHQLFMEDTALAVLVFDGQKEDLFEALGQWDRDLARASRKPFVKLLAAGRVDTQGLRAGKSQIESFAKERGFTGYLETSAKHNIGCEDLKHAIVDNIRWDEIPWRSSPRLFKRLKDTIIGLKDERRILMRFNELKEAVRLRLLSAEAESKDSDFKDEELKAVIGLLAGPGVVWELAFGSWVLLQPESINAYAQAVIQTISEDKYERGCLPEGRVFQGELTYHSSLKRLEADEERIVLLAMHQVLVERGLCLREPAEHGPLLVFPSYYRRERPELPGNPAVLVSYTFNGFLDDIYATLVVKLHHTNSFRQDQLWRYAADFKTLTDRQLGIKLTRHSEGAGEIELYFEPAIATEEKIIFTRYVHEHLLQKAQGVERLRHYVCPHCGTGVENRKTAMRRLQAWLDAKQDKTVAARIMAWFGKFRTPTIVCPECEKRVPLWDDLEQCFASPETQLRVRELQEQAAIVLRNASKDRVLVGEVISTVALADQISREFNVSDQGIDMEIEFCADNGEATGKKLYLQLKSGDSYLRERKSDGAEIFTIRDERHGRYWMDQAFPVMLVIRNSDGEVRWMEVRDWLKNASGNGKTQVKRIVFEGERFDVMSVRHWRDRVLGQAQAAKGGM